MPKAKKAKYWQKQLTHPNDMPVITKKDRQQLATIDRYDDQEERYAFSSLVFKDSRSGTWKQVG